MIGLPKLGSGKLKGYAQGNPMIGLQALEHRSSLDIRYPVEDGVVKNWEDMELLWNHAFGPEKLNITPSECKIMYPTAPLATSETEEKTAEYLFEKYGFDSVSFKNQVSCYCKGVTTTHLVTVPFNTLITNQTETPHLSCCCFSYYFIHQYHGRCKSDPFLFQVG